MSDSFHHPVALERLLFTKCSVEAIPGHQPSEGLTVQPPENALNVSRTPDDAQVYEVVMRTTLNASKDKAAPYSVEMEAIALLRIDKELPEAEAQRAALITGHNVLFGAIRESVSWITGRGVYGPLMLGLSVLRPPPPATEANKS